MDDDHCTPHTTASFLSSHRWSIHPSIHASIHCRVIVSIVSSKHTIHPSIQPAMVSSISTSPIWNQFNAQKANISYIFMDRVWLTLSSPASGCSCRPNYYMVWWNLYIHSLWNAIVSIVEISDFDHAPRPPTTLFLLVEEDLYVCFGVYNVTWLGKGVTYSHWMTKDVIVIVIV